MFKNLFFIISIYHLFSACSAILNYTLYKGNPQQITIPGSYYQSEDPFAASLTTKMISTHNFNLAMNLSTLTYSSALESSFCSYNPFQISIYPLISIAMANTSKNFEFISVENYVYFFDTNRNLLIYYLNRTSENVILGFQLVNQYTTEYDVKDSSYLEFYNDKANKLLYLVVDSTCYMYSLNSSLAFPIYVDKFIFNFRNSSITTADYSQGCFVFLLSNKYVDMFCMNSIKSGFDVTQSLLETEITALLVKNGKTNVQFNYTDLLIDENNVLIISDFNYGLIIINLNNTKQPVLMGIQEINAITMVRKFYQSTMVVRQFTSGVYLENHFEEYFTRIDLQNNTFTFDQNTAFLLNYDEIKSLHLARNYAILFQSSSMKLYRHSISKLLNPALIPLQGFLNEGILGVHRFEGDGDKNLFVAVFPYKLTIYNIDILNISLKCQVPIDLKKGSYLLNMSLYTSFCSLLEHSEFGTTTFPACLYQIPAIVSVYDSGTTVSENDKSGLIAGLVVGLFFAIVLILLCACYLFRMTRKYDYLESTKRGGGQHVQLAAGTGGIIGGYEDSEKRSNEPREYDNYNNKIEMAVRSQE